MVKIRLRRMGRSKLPFYRVVVVDSRSCSTGAYLDLVGTYEPIKGVTSFNEEKVIKYLQIGAQPTNVVRSLLTRAGIWKNYKDQKMTK